MPQKCARTLFGPINSLQPFLKFTLVPTKSQYIAKYPILGQFKTSVYKRKDIFLEEKKTTLVSKSIILYFKIAYCIILLKFLKYTFLTLIK